MFLVSSLLFCFSDVLFSYYIRLYENIRRKPMGLAMG